MVSPVVSLSLIAQWSLLDETLWQKKGGRGASPDDMFISLLLLMSPHSGVEGDRRRGGRGATPGTWRWLRSCCGPAIVVVTMLSWPGSRHGWLFIPPWRVLDRRNSSIRKHGGLARSKQMSRERGISEYRRESTSSPSSWQYPSGFYEELGRTETHVMIST